MTDRYNSSNGHNSNTGSLFDKHKQTNSTPPLPSNNNNNKSDNKDLIGNSNNNKRNNDSVDVNDKTLTRPNSKQNVLTTTTTATNNNNNNNRPTYERKGVTNESVINKDYEVIRKQIELAEQQRKLREEKDAAELLEQQKLEEELKRKQAEEEWALKEKKLEAEMQAIKDAEIEKEKQRKEQLRINLLTRPNKCLKKQDCEKEYHERFIWIDQIHGDFYWSKTNNASDPKAKCINIKTHITGINIGANKDFPSFQILLNPKMKSSNLKSAANAINICMDDMPTVMDMSKLIMKLKNL